MKGMYVRIATRSKKRCFPVLRSKTFKVTNGTSTQHSTKTIALNCKARKKQGKNTKSALPRLQIKSSKKARRTRRKETTSISLKSSENTQGLQKTMRKRLRKNCPNTKKFPMWNSLRTLLTQTSTSIIVQTIFPKKKRTDTKSISSRLKKTPPAKSKHRLIGLRSYRKTTRRS